MKATTAIRQCEKIWMSQKEAVKYLGVSKDWFKDRRLDGTLHFSKVANTIFYIKSEIDAAIVNGAIAGRQMFRNEVAKTRQ